MKRDDHCLERQRRLKQQIVDKLDFLIGTVNKTPAQTGHYLTAKVEGKTVTRYVRKAIVKQATEMTKRHEQLRQLMRRLSVVNWEILKRQSE